MGPFFFVRTFSFREAPETFYFPIEKVIFLTLKWRIRFNQATGEMMIVLQYPLVQVDRFFQVYGQSGCQYWIGT